MEESFEIELGGASALVLVCLLKIVVVSQFLASHNSSITSKQRHTWLSSDSPLDHPAIRLTRMVDKPGDRATTCVDNHFIMKCHKVVALPPH